MKTGKKWIVCMLCVCAMLTGLLTGCGKKPMTDAEYEEIAKGTAADNAKKVVMTIEKNGKVTEVTLDRLTYYLAYYELEGRLEIEKNAEALKTFYGENADLWALPASGSSMTTAQAYKEMVRVSILYTELMYSEAVKAGLKLTDERRDALESLTTNFLNNYSAAERARCGMTRDVIYANYERVLLADQFSELATNNVTVDRDEVAKSIDKDQYRVYKVNYLYVSKSNDNEELVKAAGDVANRQKTMQSCYERAQNGEQLETIINDYKDFMYLMPRDITRVTASNYEPDFCNAVFEMKTGEIKLLDTTYGIYVIELLDASEFFGYEDAVDQAVEEEKSRKVKNIYNDIEKNYTIKTTDGWDEINMGTILQEKK